MNHVCKQFFGWVAEDKKPSAKSGFTLLEILLTVSIMSLATLVVATAFSTATMAWKRGTEISDSMNHGDFVMDQLAMALRSAFYQGDNGDSPDFGFWHEDDGDGIGASDSISWVKVGSSLVGRHCEFAGTPHRVEFFLEPYEDGMGVAVKAWRLFGQTEEFDPDDIDPEYISDRVMGFSCRTAKVMDDDGEVEWEDEWEDTNCIPPAVELTVYLQPTEEDDDPIELIRIVELPIARDWWEKE